ncbi:MAG TPA: acyl carrier protein [Propionibacteriaceae bacterium]
MNAITSEELQEIIVMAEGDDPSAVTVPDFLDTTFGDLGLDSLALLEVVGTVQRLWGAVVDDAELASLSTPRELLEIVNGQLASAAA